MRPKSLILLALALGCGLVASIGISQVMDRNASSGTPTYETSPIYVAMHNINQGDPIDGTMVTLQEWPKDKIPQGAVAKLEDLEGRRPRTLIIQGEPILEAKMLAKGELDDPISQIPRNMRLKTISVDAQTSAAGLLAPGDRVDIQLYVARNPSAGIDISKTKIILQDIRVFAVDSTVQRAADGSDIRAIAKTISLVLTPDQANKVALAEQVGELSLIPRSPNDDQTVDSGEVNLEDLLGTATNVKNSREKEQNRDSAQPTSKDGGLGGLVSNIIGQLKSTAENRPPFVMEIIEGEEVRVEEFDPFTGRPLRAATSSKSKSVTSPSGLPAPAPAPSAMPQPELPAIELPIDFSAE
jgi:pilus assembly protein CpaB